MNDHEINLRLAEIAEVSVTRIRSIYSDTLLREGTTYEWSPLTDWSQLGPLMERECVSASFDYDYPTAVGWVTQVYAKHDRLAEENHPDLKRAIALAIIGAHEND